MQHGFWHSRTGVSFYENLTVNLNSPVAQYTLRIFHNDLGVWLAVIQKSYFCHTGLDCNLYWIGRGPGDGVHQQLTADITTTGQLLGRQIDAIIAMWNLLRQGTRWVLNQPGHRLDISAMIGRLSEGLVVLEKKIRQSLNVEEKARVEELAGPLLAGGMPRVLANRTASLHLLYPALDVVETAARRKSDVLSVATVFFGLGDRLSLKWLRDCVERLPVEGQWHAHARGNLRDELYTQHRKLAGRVLEAFPDEKNPVTRWIEANADDVARVSDMMGDMYALGSMDYATVSVAVRSLDQLLQATASP